MDEKSVLYIPATCPCCGTPLSVGEDRKAVVCPVCDHVYPTTLLFRDGCAEIEAAECTADKQNESPEAAAKEARSEKARLALAAEGIDAEEAYLRAVKAEEAGENDAVVLRLFEPLRGYRDVDERIERKTAVFYFGKRYLEIGGKQYYTRQENVYAFGSTFSLFEIKDGLPGRSPVLTGVSKILRSFGTYIYFLRADRWLCVYDTAKTAYGKVTVLDAGAPGDFLFEKDSDLYLSGDGKTFVYRKKLPIEWKKTGCFSWFFSIFRKKPVGIQNKFNNYSLMAVDMATQSCRTLLPEIVAVTDAVGDNFFYSLMPKKFEYDMEFHVYNLKTGEDKKILNSDCIIHRADEREIIFSLRAQSRHNLNLYAMDPEGHEATLLERNVYDFYAKEGDRVYYTVGNGKDFHLLSVKTDGTLRREVLSNVGEPLLFSDGFVYYAKNVGGENYLMRVDETGKQHSLVASHFGSIVRKTDNVVYYLTAECDLRRVLLNGQEDILIAKDVCSDRLVLTETGVFYCGKDLSGEEEVSSLFFLNAKTGVLRKVAYRVGDFCDYDAETVFFSRSEKRLYEVPTMDPRDEQFYKEEFRVKKTVCAEIVKFCKYDKATGVITDVLTLGIPTETGARLLPNSCAFARDGIAARGEIYAAVRNAAPAEQTEKVYGRLEKARAKQEKKYARRKRRADRRAMRKRKRAIRKGLYPSLPKFATYENELSISHPDKQ